MKEQKTLRQTPLSREMLYGALGLFAKFALGFVLSRAVIFEHYAPFGVSWVAAAGGGIGGVFALCGTIAGTVTIWSSVDIMKYLAITVLIYAAGAVFRPMPVSRRPAFMPLCVILTYIFVGFVFLAGEGFTLTNFTMFISESLLMTGAAFFYSLIGKSGINEGKLKRGISILLLSATVLISVAGLSVGGVFYPARAVAGLMVLYCAWQGGMGIGSAAGLTIGLAIDLSVGYPFFSMSFGFAGLLSGLFRRGGKVMMSVIFIAAAAVAALWAGTSSLRLSVLIEAAVTGAVFAALPLKGGARGFSTPEDDFLKREVGRRAQSFARRRLIGASSAFRELYENLSTIFEKDRHKNDNDIAMVFDRVADKLCRRCQMRVCCWETNNAQTCHALADASGRLLRSGRASESDFPGYFASQCTQLKKFVEYSNNELDEMLKRRQYRARLNENRNHVCRQYAEMSRILSDVAEDVAQGLEFDTVSETQVERFLDSKRVKAQAAVYRDISGRRRVELSGDNISSLLTDELFLTELSERVGFMLSLPEQIKSPEGERLLFPEAELLQASIGAVSHKKEGQNVSGDYGVWFKTGEGKIYMILADGMGSGREASDDAQMACSLLERFLKAGIAPEVSLEMLNSSLVLRSEVDSAFVTVDLLICDLFTGETRIFKHGAAASYIKRDGRISRISGGNLPAGAQVTKPDMTRISLAPGDMIFLMSDGIVTAGDDLWLKENLSSNTSIGPKEMAEKLLETAVSHHGRNDDMTVLALAIKRVA